MVNGMEVVRNTSNSYRKKSTNISFGGLEEVSDHLKTSSYGLIISVKRELEYRNILREPTYGTLIPLAKQR